MLAALASYGAKLPPPLPSLTVNDEGRVFLHAWLATSLQLEVGQPANLVPPPTGSLYWHLDLRAEAERFLTAGNSRNLRLNGVRLPFGLLDPDEPPLTLYLLPGPPAQPGYYPLLPAAAFAQAYAAFLEQAAQAARQAQTPT